MSEPVQVLVKLEPRQLELTLQVNAQLNRHVRRNCVQGHVMMSKMGREYWRLNPKGQRLDIGVQLEEFYAKHCHVRVAYADASRVGGFMVLSGELLAFHNIVKGNGLWMLDHAIELGADRLDHFDVPVLNKLYKSRGFVEILREKNVLRGAPDIVFRRLK